MKSKKRKPVTIVWEDAITIANESLDSIENRPPELVETFGILIKTDSYHIVMTHDSHGDCNDYLRIPSELVRKIIR